MRKVLKYPFPFMREPEFLMELPKGSKPLKVDFDPEGNLVAWAEVPVEEKTGLVVSEKESYLFTIVGTGVTILADAGDYLNTFFSNPFVYHAYFTKEIPDE